MSGTMDISASETGVVRIFAIDLATDAAQAFDIAALQHALGSSELNADHVDLLEIADLEELGLRGYLTDGMGIAAEEITPFAMQLDALDGRVAVIRSAAFTGTHQTLSPRAPLRWIASFGEVPLDLTAAPLSSKSAIGTLSSAPAPVSHTKTLMWVLAALAFFVIATISMLIRITA